MKGTNNEDMQFRLNLLTEELGELAACVTKGKSREEFVEENIDLIILVLGNFISKEVTAKEIDAAFWQKYEKIMNRQKKKIGKNYRVSEFK